MVTKKKQPRPKKTAAAKGGEAKAVSKRDYNAVARSANLLSIRMLSSNFSVKPEYFSKLDDGNKDLKKFYEHKITEFIFREDIGGAFAQFEWKMGVKSGRKTLLNLKTTYLIIYGDLKGKNPDAVEIFVKKVGEFATYPYFRAFASQINWESGAELPVLPVIST